MNDVVGVNCIITMSTTVIMFPSSSSEQLAAIVSPFLKASAFFCVFGAFVSIWACSEAGGIRVGGARRTAHAIDDSASNFFFDGVDFFGDGENVVFMRPGITSALGFGSSVLCAQHCGTAEAGQEMNQIFLRNCGHGQESSSAAAVVWFPCIGLAGTRVWRWNGC